MKCPQCFEENKDDSRFCHKCATPLSPGDRDSPPFTKTILPFAAELSRGSVVADRYEVIEELGRGGMGKVYKVYDRKIKEVVALKLIRPEISLSEKVVERFKNELRIARKIAHRFVCRMYDVGEEGFSHFITMEYVPGEDLKAFIRRSGQITPYKAVSLAQQVSEGLAEAHRLGVVHRDLKPQNIMIDKQGNSRIMDFGIARFQEAEGLTGTGAIMGTPEYMSPEQAELKEVDPRTDIYALGVVLFEMVTGKVPFEGETPLSIALKHRSQPPQNPRELNPHIPPALAQVILKCLAKDRTKRIQSAEDLAADLTSISQGLPRVEKGATRREPITSREITVRFRMKKILLPALALIFLAGAFILWRTVFYQAKGPGVRGSVEHRSPDFPHAPAVPVPGSGQEGPGPISRLTDEVQKYLKIKDIGELSDPEKFMEALRGVLPQESTALEALDKASEKLRESKKLRQEGRADEADKSSKEGRVEMQKLMAQVADRQYAQDTQIKMMEARLLAQRSGKDEKNLLYRLSRYEERNADEALVKGDFSGARTLYAILESLYRQSLSCEGDRACTATLQQLAATLEVEVRGLPAGQADPWMLAYADQIKSQAVAYFGRAEYDNAAASYLQVLFLLQKIKNK
jgi:tRNA A-37 threonylcarbamoyl transferase component Bud32